MWWRAVPTIACTTRSLMEEKWGACITAWVRVAGARPGAGVGVRIRLSPHSPHPAGKPLRCATAQFGRNHLGGRDEHLPTAHGFDEFFGILHHLTAGEYAEEYDFPRDPAVIKQFGFGHLDFDIDDASNPARTR